MRITLNVTDRKPLVNLISSFTGEAAVYMRTPTYAYQIGGFTVTREGNLDVPDGIGHDALERLLHILAGEGYHPLEALQQPEIMGLTVTMPKDKADVDNLNALFAVKGSLIKEALGINALTVEVGEDAVSFPWFEEMPDSDSVEAYTRFISSICELSVSQGCTTPDGHQEWDELYRLIEMLPHAGITDGDNRADHNSRATETEDESVEPAGNTGAAEIIKMTEAADEHIVVKTNLEESVEVEETAGGQTGTDGNGNILEQAVAVEKTPPRTADPAVPETPGLSAEILNRLNSLRSSLIREINRQFNEIIRTANTSTPYRNIPVTGENAGTDVVTGGSASITLYGDIGILRGTKPTVVKYDDKTILVSSWKRAFATVLDICNQQDCYHEALLAMRDETVGRGRKIVADSPQGMLSPLKVDDGLYVETNFSTEALLKLLRDRILNRIDFDASGITFEYRHS